MDEHAGTVAALWRYPVKSLRGERLEALPLEPRGPVGDRLWALVDEDGKIASGKDSRRFRRVPDLLRHASRCDHGVPVLELADGRAVRADEPALAAAVAALAGPGWRLARERSVRHHDAAPVHVVTTATLAALTRPTGGVVEPDRLRPNILLDAGAEPGFPEDGWIGRRLAVGDAVLRIVERTERCVMTTHAQAGLPHRPRVLKGIGRANEACAGVYAEVLTPGTVRAGDAARLLP